MPMANKVVETTDIRFGFSSTMRPKVAAHIPKKKIIRVNPMSAWNFEMPKHSMMLTEYWE